jgi:hypothetical protein
VTATDAAIAIFMGVAAIVAAASFSMIVRYLFDRGLADRSMQTPDLRKMYRTYMNHTRKETGRMGTALWIHGGSAAIFILAGVAYTIFRFILPRFI